MMSRARGKFVTLAAAALLLAAFAAAQQVPSPASLKPHGFVNDYAHVLSPSAAAQLEAAAEALNQQLKVQVAMVTVPTTGQMDTFDYSYNLAEHWGVGAKVAANGQDKDTGLLIFLAIKDHKYFTQVGYGLEPYITDADVGSWMRALRPQLRAGQYGAVFAGMLQQIETTLAARMPGAAQRLQQMDASMQMPGAGRRQFSGGQDPRAQLGFLAFLFIIWLVGAFSMRGRGGGGCFWPLMFFGMMGGFGGGGGGGWGGGFGGGGGGFGGFGGGGFGGGGAGGGW